MVIIFVIGLGVLTDGLGESTGPGGASATQSITQAIIGALILLMGGFAPWLAIKLVHFGGDHFHQVHGHAQAALAGAQSVAAAPQKAQAMAGRFGAAGLGAASAGGPNPVGSSPVGSRVSGNGWESDQLEWLTEPGGSRLSRSLARSPSSAAGTAACRLSVAAGRAPPELRPAVGPRRSDRRELPWRRPAAAKGTVGEMAAHVSDASSSTAPSGRSASGELSPPGNPPSPQPPATPPPSSPPPKSA